MGIFFNPLSNTLDIGAKSAVDGLSISPSVVSLRDDFLFGAPSQGALLSSYGEKNWYIGHTYSGYPNLATFKGSASYNTKPAINSAKKFYGSVAITSPTGTDTGCSTFLYPYNRFNYWNFTGTFSFTVRVYIPDPANTYFQAGFSVNPYQVCPLQTGARLFAFANKNSDSDNNWQIIAKSVEGPEYINYYESGYSPITYPCVTLNAVKDSAGTITFSIPDVGFSASYANGWNPDGLYRDFIPFIEVGVNAAGTPAKTIYVDYFQVTSYANR